MTNSISSNGIQSIKSTLPLISQYKPRKQSDTLTFHNCFTHTHTQTHATHTYCFFYTHTHTTHTRPHTQMFCLSCLVVRLLSLSISLNHTRSQTQTRNTHSLTFVIDHIFQPQRLLTWHNILQLATTRSNMPASPGSPNI